MKKSEPVTFVLHTIDPAVGKMVDAHYPSVVARDAAAARYLKKWPRRSVWKTTSMRTNQGAGR